MGARGLRMWIERFTERQTAIKELEGEETDGIGMCEVRDLDMWARYCFRYIHTRKKSCIGFWSTQ